MSSKIKIESAGRFGTAIHKALIVRELSLVEFSRIIDSNYEFQRKILRGEAFPSDKMLGAMVKPLELDKSAMEVLLAQDRMEKKTGEGAFSAALGRHKRASEFDAILPHLSEEQIDRLLLQMRAMLKN